jgi:hypothetical protein
MLPIEIKQRILRLLALKELISIARPRHIFRNEVLHQLELAILYLQWEMLGSSELPHRGIRGNIWERDICVSIDHKCGPKKLLVDASDTTKVWNYYAHPTHHRWMFFRSIERPSY